jgi:peptidoglycan/LPS O-acetylase OafA/YrhL
MQPYCPLGALRFLLAFFVFSAHTSTIYDPFSWLSRRIGPIELANIGVWSFFVVSGYIVVRAAYDFYRGNALGFIINRSLRIFPAFVVCLGLSWALLLGMGITKIDPGVPPAISIEGLGLREFFLGMSIFGSASDHRVLNPNPPSWTIFVEAVFYAVVALTLFTRICRFEHALAVAGTIAAVLFFCPPWTLELGPLYIENATGAFKHGAFFILGASLFLMQRGGGAVAVASFIASAIMSLGAVFGLQHTFTMPELFKYNASTTANLFGMTFFLAVFSALSSERLSLWFSRQGNTIRKTDIGLGDLTYPLYLCHVPVLAVLWTDPLNPRNFKTWLISLAACIIVDLIINIVVEKPLQRIRNRFRGRKL